MDALLAASAARQTDHHRLLGIARGTDGVALKPAAAFVLEHSSHGDLSLNNPFLG